ncbi:MAG: DsrE family protein [Gammaproteobacteria bacterium]|jgi:intracellular sulfur oxidation DsrE/DsrF family protein
MRFIKSVAILMAMALSLVGFTAQAGDFAEQKIVLQVSDKASHTLALNVASNLVKHYGQDRVSVEVVAFGPGLGLLVDSPKNKNNKRVTSLAGSGVKFSACGNTIRKMTKKNKGKAPKINAKAKTVPAGVVRIVELQDQGYKLIKP